MKIFKSLFVIFLGCFFATQAFAGSDYIYRHRVQWVKIKQANPKDVPLGSLKHPFTGVNADQMEAMLLAIKINKKYMFKKDLKTIDVFSTFEARKFAPMLVRALSQVDADQVVNFSVVHKRPIFILRNDYISIANLWASDDGVHVQFTKLFAKLDGDYEASANADKFLKKAKGIHLTLEAGPGQKLSYFGPTEIILDPNHDFITQVAGEKKAEGDAEEASLMGNKRSKNVAEKSPSSLSERASQEPQESGDAAERLQKIKTLRDQKLISGEEYQQLRKKILSEI